MFAERPAIQRLSGGRLHLQHGPIDVVLKAWTAETHKSRDASNLARAYEAAAARFQTILGELVAELGELRRPIDRGPQVTGPVACRMVEACAPFAGLFITPMAAVAGAVADELLAAMLDAAPLAKAFANDGGDIAVHIAPGERLEIGMAGDMTGGEIPAMNGRITLAAEDGVGGIATSGRGGRSFSLGIADSVTVLAHNAAAADAAATLIANAVNIDSPAIRRARASSLDPDSDLGECLVTVDVGPLTHAEVAAALEAGERRAVEFRRAGSIAACALTLKGKTLIVGAGTALRSLSEGSRHDHSASQDRRP
jgi:ApbE superfamily uncharacterized protein (UPF0280 family)